MKKCLKRTKNTKNHKHAKNHNHMTCRSSDRVQTSFLPILGHFCFFTPFLTQKIKLFEKWKKKKPEKKPTKETKKIRLEIQWTLSISNFSPFRTKSSVPWTFVYSLRYFLSLYLELLYLNFFLYLEQKSWSLATISIFISKFFPSKSPFKQQIEQKCSIFENSNVIKRFEIRKSDCNQNTTKCKGFVLN